MNHTFQFTQSDLENGRLFAPYVMTLDCAMVEDASGRPVAVSSAEPKVRAGVAGLLLELSAQPGRMDRWSCTIRDLYESHPDDFDFTRADLPADGRLFFAGMPGGVAIQDAAGNPLILDRRVALGEGSAVGLSIDCSGIGDATWHAHFLAPDEIDQPDYSFTAADLADGVLFLAGVPEGFVVYDSQWRPIVVDSRDTRNQDGVRGWSLDCSAIAGDTWHVRFPNRSHARRRDFDFTKADLPEDGRLFFAGLAGGVGITDQSGEPIMLDRRIVKNASGTVGLSIDCSGIGDETWHAHFFGGDDGDCRCDDCGMMRMQYSPDRVEWHDVLDPAGDAYMRLSNDGGKTWTPAMPMGGSDDGEEESSSSSSSSSAPDDGSSSSSSSCPSGCPCCQNCACRESCPSGGECPMDGGECDPEAELPEGAVAFTAADLDPATGMLFVPYALADGAVTFYNGRNAAVEPGGSRAAARSGVAGRLYLVAPPEGKTWHYVLDLAENRGKDDFDFVEDDLELVTHTLFFAGIAASAAIYRPGLERIILDQSIVTDQNGVRGLSIDCSGIGGETWHAHYVVGKPRSCECEGALAVQYSADGTTWDDTQDDGDKYMRFSADGGKTWTPAMAIASTGSGGSGSSSYSGKYIHNFIEPMTHEVQAVADIINTMVYPQIWMFCEIMVHYEVCNRASDGAYHFTYHHWNRAYPPQVFLNGSDMPLDGSLYEVNYDEGYITPKFAATTGDNLICTYNFSWFTPETLASYIYRSIGTINYHGQGAVTNYTVETLPESFYGIAADLAVAMCCENLLLSITVFYGRLWLAFTGNDLYGGGGGDVASQLETIKRNSEDRAYAQLENERTRAPYHLSKPTPAYWRSISMGTGIRPGPHGQIGYGKLRGIKINKGTGYIAGLENGDNVLGI